MPPRPSGVARQRLLAAAAGLGVAALAAASFVLSYDDLRALALAGGATRRYAPVYPGMIDTLVVVTILSLVLARRTPWWARGMRWLLLLALLAGAAAASAQRAVKGYDPLPDKWLSAGVAVAPWVLLLLAAWLWLSMFRQAKLLFGRPGAGAGGRGGALPPTGTVRVVAAQPAEPPREEAAPVIPGLAAPPAEPADVSPNVPSGLPAKVPATLPTDIKLVTHRRAARITGPAGEDDDTETTQPDLVMPRRRDDAGRPQAADDVDDYALATDRAEDPDADVPAGAAGRTSTDTAPPEAAGDDEGEDEDDVERWSALAAEDAERWAHEAADHFGGPPAPDGAAPTVEWIPPASRFRSSPTPPRD
ncbi:MAG TPA: DUF2637 domain-containing protein [Streptosporangiaceae bacterium]